MKICRLPTEAAAIDRTELGAAVVYPTVEPTTPYPGISRLSDFELPIGSIPLPDIGGAVHTVTGAGAIWPPQRG
jgi:hypothetical protein